ncbi:REP-associated tyrosine transposase [Geotalea toluenoxydans]|uniref:REP-associated tyrosine transposase n=1 Tax=Geotalea toluenoxydans TaxID=421624 RepID=UPI0006CFCEE9|nr:transposase [Geotalea toluenoxydans]
MARPLRVEYEGAVYHVTARGNERGKIFFSKRDYEKFKGYLAIAKEKYGFILHAYVLMTNHYHLIIETPQKNLSKIMHYINSSYTAYTNVKRKRVGHLFQGRYKAILVDKDNYLLELSRYLHLNPVRVNMVQNPEEYPHSSYRSYVTGQTENIVSSDTILEMMTAKKKDAPDNYRNFVETGLGEEIASPLQKVFGGIILGDEGFIRDALARVELGRIETPEVSHGKALRSAMGLEEIISACCEYFEVAREEIMRDKRSEARKACIYLMKKHTCATNREIAKLFGTLSYSAVAKISQNISQQLGVDKSLQERIKGLQVKNSLFKA